MQFTAVDGGVAIVILISGILAYARGFMREVMAILAWVAAAVAGYYLAPTVQPLISEVPVIGNFLRDNCELGTIAAFAAVFAATLLVVSIFTPLFSGAVRRSSVGGLDQALGFLFGVARGVILVAIGFVVYTRVISTQPVPMIDNSESAKIFAQLEAQINQQIPAKAPVWVEDRYKEVMAKCKGTGLGTATTPPATTTAPATGQ
jgi:membrane protein required for colicin V production